jgi:hypothetical protein
MMMAQQTQSRTKGAPRQRSMADAIARAKAAAARQDRARAAGVEYTRGTQKVLFGAAKIPDHPHARLLQKVTIGLLITGMLMIIFLPDIYIVHVIAFTCMFALLFIGTPNFLLQSSGAASPTKIAGWTALLLLFGAMTATAMGDTGNLWSWAPWLSQFAVGAHAPHHVIQPHP